jgi:hypothetical protein
MVNTIVTGNLKACMIQLVISANVKSGQSNPLMVYKTPKHVRINEVLYFNLF